MSVLLDTHVWVRWLLDAEPISGKERAALGQLAAFGLVFVAAISLWEIQMLHQRGRVPLKLPFERWIRQAANPEVVKVLPLDTDVVIALDSLPAGFHGDPADRLIVATARAYDLPLATYDTAVRKSRVVKLWKP